jgi:DNA polymerase elongation subunit (family B)
MLNLEINENPKNLFKVALLHEEIFANTPLSKNKNELVKEWEEVVSNGGTILTVNADEFDYPFAFAVLKKDNNNLLIDSSGVKNNFRKQGVWGYFFDFIVFYCEKNQIKNLEIKNIPAIFPEMNKFIYANNFIEKEKKDLGNGNSLVTFIKEI